jgi:hypothetical protein
MIVTTLDALINGLMALVAMIGTVEETGTLGGAV